MLRRSIPTIPRLTISFLRNNIYSTAYISTRYSSTTTKRSPPRPSQSYIETLGTQPDQAPLEPIKPTEEDEDKAKLEKILTRRSIRMSIYQMFLIILVGSSVLNIMREKNYIEELDDAYAVRFKKFEKLIKGLEDKDDRLKVVIEDVEDELKSINERFEVFFGEKGISKFDGVRGLKGKSGKLGSTDDNDGKVEVLETFL